MKSQKFWIVIIRQDERRLQTCLIHPDSTQPLLLQLALKITVGLQFLNFKIIVKNVCADTKFIILLLS